ncbi:MAG: NADH-quinone oxidoreductase subunit A [Planctomycetota bacterium]|nr:NADH-quinone oxidoreductase subunit A [Planctomycetota bacterium]MCX8039457.1 NADH-quinone oxidoreductase subunit A [Planctomycetota bacterium]MDW8373576.1 NADH-quinone oxidoreductase subunit A [Planctomycetota bacterium]
MGMEAASGLGAWGSVAAIAALAVLVVGGALAVVRLVTRILDRIRDPRERLTTYECGEQPVGSAWFRFNNRFTTIALTFLVCDIELALLWPILPRALDWLAAGEGARVFLEVSAFVGILAIALIWVAARGGFRWDREVSDG